MAEHALIACRVTSETKARVRKLAERDGITESTLVRQLLDVVLRTAGVDEPIAMAAPDKVNRDARLNVRLEPEDWRLLKERARARGMASATYLSCLARSHLRGAAPLPKMEYTLLKQSVEQLSARVPAEPATMRGGAPAVVTRGGEGKSVRMHAVPHYRHV